MRAPIGGMVVAPQPLAVAAGARVLMGGGNAVDAAVTTAFVQMVVDPQMCGVAGFGTAHVWQAETGASTVVDFQGRAGSKATPEMWRDLIEEEYWNGYGYRLQGFVNDVGYGSITTPGTVAGLAETLRQFGTIGWDQAIRPAVPLARDGFLVSRELYRLWTTPPIPGRPDNALRTAANEAARRLYRKDDGSFYYPGQRFRNPDFAITLERLASAGPEDFYTGELGQRMAADLEQHGSFVTADDLKGYTARVLKPHRSTYRGYTVDSPAEPNGGLTVLQMLNILENYDLKGMGLNTTEYVYTVARAMQAATFDRVTQVGDPEFVPVPAYRLLGKEHAQIWRRRIDSGSPIHIPRYAPEAPHTTNVTVRDRQGNLAIITHSLGSAAGVVCDGLGFMYNNLMNCFDPQPGRVNSIVPGKARVTGMCPTIVFDADGRPVLALGAPGGTRIMTGVLQTILNVLDHGLTAVEAVSAPRFDSQSEHLDAEARIPEWVLAPLAERGFKLSPNPSALSMFALVQAIVLDHAKGEMQGGSDPRGGGCVLTDQR